jgi:hypothetical protein
MLYSDGMSAASARKALFGGSNNSFGSHTDSLGKILHGRALYPGLYPQQLLWSLLLD